MTLSAVKPADNATAADGPHPSGRDNGEGGTQQIAQLVGDLSTTLSGAISEIEQINARTRLLALNARIEAARAGAAGDAFSVVAGEVQGLSSKTSSVAQQLASSTRTSIASLMHTIGTRVRGMRLSDIALTNIDLIDRNLYERSCDVRWWATDSSVVEALTLRSKESYQFACHRLGVILNAYTVYLDLVLCDRDGQIVANGRPEQFGSIGTNVSDSTWFKAAIQTQTGDEYGFQGAHRSSLVDDKHVLIYSCAVRDSGQRTGQALGILGIIFNWESFAAAILDHVPLGSMEKSATRCCIVEPQGLIVADSFGKQLEERFDFAIASEIQVTPKGFSTCRYLGKDCCIGFAKAPGFETYSTGWYSLVIQPMDS
jgi:hypothetical protein